MKRVGILIIALLTVCIVAAQEVYKHSLNGIKLVRIEAEANVKLTGDGASDEMELYSKKEHIRKDDKTKGLKAIYTRGEDNTGFGFEIEKQGDILIVRDVRSFIQSNPTTIKLPKNIAVFLDCGNLGGARVDDFSSEIEIRTNVGEIDLVNVTGPIIAYTSAGDINVEFGVVNQLSPISIKSAAGDVDVSLPANTKASLELRSTVGSVYTDFDLEVPRKDGLRVVGANRKITGNLNNGGVRIALSSSAGDVYLRRK